MILQILDRTRYRLCQLLRLDCRSFLFGLNRISLSGHILRNLCIDRFYRFLRV